MLWEQRQIKEAKPEKSSFCSWVLYARFFFFSLLYLFHLFIIRRSPFLDLYTTDQVHLLPGYPTNASGPVQVAFYVQQPLGLFIGNVSVLPSNTVLDIVVLYKSELESAIRANITDLEALFTLPTLPTLEQSETSTSDLWKWLAKIGVSVGVVVIILVTGVLCWR